MSYLSNHKDKLLFLPLGGSGEIGMNLNLYGAEGRWLMVDLGMSFCDERYPGCDLLFPDTRFIEEEQEDLEAIVLTHGHEDHIGALPHLWKRLRVPVYATAFTAELVRGKLQEHGLEGIVPLHIVKPHEEIDLGPFKVTYIPLAHSIAEGHGLVIETGKGRLFHTGDWKLDENPIIGPDCPSDHLKALGDKGVLAMLTDSTNVFNERESGSETLVYENLLPIVAEQKGRVVVTTFASNVARLDTAGRVARETGRHLVLLGRSMTRIVSAAKATGYLKDFPATIDPAEADALPKDKVMFLCTGCQGEPRAALSRIARGDHPNLYLSKGDTVIFSSKMIPGNEVSLGYLFNDLALAEINVITEKDAPIHVSGHPGQSELAQMYEWVRPTVAIPVHGEFQHLRKHRDFAKSLQVRHALAPKNGDIIEISENGAHVIDQAPFGRLILDGKELVLSGGASIVERRRIRDNGYVSVALVLDKNGDLASEPAVQSKGLPRSDDDTLEDQLITAVEEYFSHMRRRDKMDDFKVEDAVRISIRRSTRKKQGRNPTVDALIFRPEDITL